MTKDKDIDEIDEDYNEIDEEQPLGMGWNYDDLINQMIGDLEKLGQKDKANDYREIYNYILENGTGEDD